MRNLRHFLLMKDILWILWENMNLFFLKQTVLFGPSRLIPVQSIVFTFQVQHSGAMCLPDVTPIESLQLGRSGILNSSLIGHGVVKLLQSTWYHHMMKNHIPWLFCHIYWQIEQYKRRSVAPRGGMFASALGLPSVSTSEVGGRIPWNSHN